MSQVVKYIAGLLGAVIVSAYYHETVRVPQSPSNFEVACQKLNLSGDKPLALLEIFNIAGYLTPEAFWKAVYNSKAFASPEEAFQKYAQILKEAGAGKDPKDFNAELASHNLFGKSMPHFWEWFNH
ncbi:MAG UNVERIFIED_CONTAM: hypothetical protein LVR18_03410 [Planctomycetaceae bacterium]|jgi:hypothetical protein